jgi:hypothetical protein
MSSQNYFDLLADDENDDPTAVIARATPPAYGDKPVTKKSQLTPTTVVPTGNLTKLAPQPPETGQCAIVVVSRFAEVCESCPQNIALWSGLPGLELPLILCSPSRCFARVHRAGRTLSAAR